jgi:hypothetical protein
LIRGSCTEAPYFFAPPFSQTLVPCVVECPCHPLRKRDNQLRVYNPIYVAVFDEAWINTELQKLRPYSESFRAWVGSSKTDSSRLLRGRALVEAEQWAGEKAALSAEDREFLSASRAQQREEEIAAKEREAELAREKQAREAAEAAKQIQAEANQKAQQKLRLGSLVLGGALVVAALFGISALFSGITLRRIQQEQQEIVQHNETSKVLSGLIGDLYDNDKPEAAQDAIAQIGLSYTDFTGDSSELKQALLNSSIALAHLHLISSEEANEGAQEQINEAQTRVDKSVQLVEDYPNVFESASGQAIAFFTYAVQGNLREEQDYLRKAQEPTSAQSSYEQAFRYTAATPDLNSENMADSFDQLLNSVRSSSKAEQFQSLVTAALKKHYDFRARQLIRELEPAATQYHWREADRLTTEALEASALSRDLSFSYENISCDHLREIDTLWFDNSTGRFGFRVQKEIY